MLSFFCSHQSAASPKYLISSRLISSASAYRTPSQSRPHSPGPGTPSTGRELHHQQHQHQQQQQQEFVSSTLRSQSSAGAEFRPVHTTPDPLTGRYADGRITPNHGFTRTFASSPALPRKATVPSQDLSIPKKPDELLHSLGQEVGKKIIRLPCLSE